MLTFYHAEFGAHSWRTLICLREKRLRFASRPVDVLRFEQPAECVGFASLTPPMPFLIHDERTISGSTAINEYLEDAFPQAPLRPWDADSRARMHAWNRQIEMHLVPAVTGIGRQILAGDASSGSDTLARVSGVLTRMESAVRHSHWLAGDCYSLADINAFPFAATLSRVHPDLINTSSRPYLKSWLDRVGRRPAARSIAAALGPGLECVPAA